jgi:hypothetical protein
MATMLLWPTMAKLRSGSFVAALLKYEKLPDIKGSAVPRSLRETPIRSAAFLVSMTGDAVSRGDIAPALRCLFAEAVLLRGIHAGHRRRSLQRRREYSPGRLDQLLSTEAHTTHSRRFNDKPLPGHGAKRAAAFSMKATFECLAESVGDRLNRAAHCPCASGDRVPYASKMRPAKGPLTQTWLETPWVHDPRVLCAFHGRPSSPSDGNARRRGLKTRWRHNKPSEISPY